MLDTDARAVVISGILHQRQGFPGEQRLRTNSYCSKKLSATKANHGALMLEMNAANYFIAKIHSYLCPGKFTLRVDNQALSWLKTHATDQALIGRWIMMALKKYHYIESNIAQGHHIIAMPMDRPNEPMSFPGGRNNLKNCHQWLKDGTFFHRTSTTSCQMLLGSMCRNA